MFKELEKLGMELSNDEQKQIKGGSNTGLLWHCDQDPSYCNDGTDPGKECGWTNCYVISSCDPPLAC